MSVERSRHMHRDPALPENPEAPGPALTEEWQYGKIRGSNLTVAGLVTVYVDVELGERKVALLVPQIFNKGDAGKPADWYDLDPIEIKRSGRRAVTFQVAGSKNFRVAVRGLGGSDKGSSVRLEYGWLERTA